MSMFPFRTRKKNVWLFTWGYSRDDYFKHLGRQKIAAIFDSRVSDGFVKRYIPLLYSTERHLMVYEKASEMYYGSTKHYSKPDWREPRWDYGKYTFGNHPWLEVRRVKNFFVDVVHAYFEISYWTEHEIYDPQCFPSLKVLRPERRVKLESRHKKSGFHEEIFFDDDAIPPGKCPKDDRDFVEAEYA